MDPERRQRQEPQQAETQVQESQKPTLGRQRASHNQSQGPLFKRVEAQPGLTSSDPQVDQEDSGADGAVLGGR